MRILHPMLRTGRLRTFRRGEGSHHLPLLRPPGNTMNIARQLLAPLLLLAQQSPAVAALNDVFPNDFYALPNGRSTATAYLYERRQVGTYDQGQRLGDFRSDSTIAVWR